MINKEEEKVGSYDGPRFLTFNSKTHHALQLVKELELPVSEI